MASSDYTNRLHDLLIFQGASPEGNVPITIAIGDVASITTGAQKVAQLFYSMLLTQTGTVAGEPTLGTDFLYELQRGGLRTESDVQAKFGYAVTQILDSMSVRWESEEVNGEIPTISPDERLTNIELINFSIEVDKLMLRVRLTTEAGDSREYFYPVTVAIT